MNNEISRIAAGLVWGQRQALTRAYQDGDDTWWVMTGYGRGLMTMGLTARSIYGAYLTPLGLAVRDHLANKGNDDA
jgi:hypothetical protein